MTYSKRALLDVQAFDEAHPGPVAASVYRAALARGHRALHAQHRHGASGPVIVHHRAWLVDQVLKHAWRQHLPLLSRTPAPSLIAVGGYGRGELHPGSDIDILILRAGGKTTALQSFVEPLIGFLWDMGLEVGHSVRTLRECVQESRADITVATNLMEARLIDGDPALLQDMANRTGPAKLWPSKKFFAAKWAEQKARHARFDDTAYNLEPNIKEGPGGLRDIQMIGWVARRHFDARDLSELVDHGFLTEEEHRALVRRRNFLWRLRNGLHFLAERAEDRLLFDHQRSLADEFGYQDADGHLAVEQLMKRYYQTVKELRLLNEILLQHFQEAVLTRKRTLTRQINRRFRDHRGFLEVSDEQVFERSPYALLELFLVLQQDPRLHGVRASTIRLVRANLHRINREFRQDITCRSLFMEIIRQPEGITHGLRKMNAYGVLGAYIPAFGKIVGQMQHDLFHVYTVDEHSLMVVRNLRRLAVAEFRHEFPMASEIIEQLAKPERLYLAALFHDIAKGRGGDHSELGAVEALRFCRDHDLSEYDAGLVAWLVRNHLLMSWAAQRQNISDPAVVSAFAEKVSDRQHLDNLYLLTMADIRGTSPAVWNSWKGQLLAQLYTATGRELQRGTGTPIDLEQRIEDVRTEAAKQLDGVPGVSPGPLARHWELLDTDYFVSHDAASIAWHAQTVLPTPTIELPLVVARRLPEHQSIQFLFFTPDREGLFSDITGGFDQLNLSIVEVRMHTTGAGFALDLFVVLAPHGQIPPQDAALDFLCQTLRRQLLTPHAGRQWAAAHLPRSLKHFPIPPRVSFNETVDGRQTVMGVVAQDRPGLLYQIARALNTCRVRLVTAKAATYGERVEDVFFVTDRDGQPLTDPALRDCLEQEIVRRLSDRAETKPSDTLRTVNV